MSAYRRLLQERIIPRSAKVPNIADEQSNNIPLLSDSN